MADAAAAIDGNTFRRVLGHYPTGVCVVTATEATGEPVGMVVGTFTSVSLDPPLVAFFPDRRSSSWPRIERAGRFCVNVLGSDQHDLSLRFAQPGVPGRDKFAGLAHRLSSGGSPVLDGVVAWIDCIVHAVHEAGDHFIALGEVCELEVEKANSPLLFYQGGYGEFATLV